MSAREDRAITQFCERLSAIENQAVTILDRPDQSNPGKGGCDAIISRGADQQALEHTTIDSFARQREDDAKFEQVVVPLEEAIRVALPDSYVWVSIPVHVIPKGIDWRGLAQQLETECIKTLLEMPSAGPWGETRPYTLNGIPFPVNLMKCDAPGNPGCHVMRIKPADQQNQLVANMVTALQNKDTQLAPYKERGFRTILLLDSDDVALVNRDTLADACKLAMTQYNPNAIDEIFIAEADNEPIWFYPVKLGDRAHPMPEFRDYFKKQYRLIYEERRWQ